MKTILLSLLLLTQYPSNFQVIVLNPDENIYIVEVASPIKIKIIKQDMLLPISCLENQVYSLNRIDFQVKPACLVDTINQTMNTDIQDYMILDKSYTKDMIKTIVKDKNIKDILQLYFDISTSITMVDAYQKATQLFRQKIETKISYPFLIKTEDGYLPLSK